MKYICLSNLANLKTLYMTKAMVKNKMHKNGKVIADNASRTLINTAGALSVDIFKTDKIFSMSNPNANKAI